MPVPPAKALDDPLHVQESLLGIVVVVRREDASAGRWCLVGGAGERRTLPAAAAYADAVNWQVGVEKFIRKGRVLVGLCESAGRDPASIRRTHAPNLQLFDSERAFARWRQDERRGMSAESVFAYIRSRGALYGTAAAIEETIEQFLDAACGGFMVFLNSTPAAHGLEQLAALPSVRRALGTMLLTVTAERVSRVSSAGLGRFLR